MRKHFLFALAAVLTLTPAGKVGAQPLSPKDSVIHVMGHAHMDMNWLWTIAETQKMANDNLRQVVAFMEEYPDFTMLLSQGSVYEFVEKQDPALFAQIQKYVKEGRIEPVGGTWVQSDQNLPSGEALTRSFLLGQTYFRDKLGRTARVGWFPDDFGHISQLPQLLNSAGMKYFYHMRTVPYNGAFIWEGSDGSTVISSCSGSYNGDINENLRKKLKDYPTGSRHAISPTGVGDHGGGPSRAQIEKVHELDAREDFPSVKFTTVEDFYKAVEAEGKDLPRHKGEMQFVFEGCYSNVAEIKEYNRKCENALYTGELFNTLEWINGNEYPSCELKAAWKEVVFNQFHDIIPGSAIYESNRESVARYIETLRKADHLSQNAFLNAIDNLPYQSGLGQPVVAFNMQPWKHRTMVTADVFSYTAPEGLNVPHWAGGYYNTKDLTVKEGADLSAVVRDEKTDPERGIDDLITGNLLSVLVKDDQGNTYPAQIVEAKLFPPGYRFKVIFFDDNIPAGGYKTYYVDVMKKGETKPMTVTGNTVETNYYTVGIDPATGDINSLIDKKTGKQYVKNGGRLNTLRIYNERKDGAMKSWLINEATSVEDVTDVVTGSVKIQAGPVRTMIVSRKKWGQSTFTVRTYIYNNSPRIEYDVQANWLETGSYTQEKDSPMLRAVFPLDIENPRQFSHVPFDVVERPANGKINLVETGILNPEDPKTVERRFGQEVPAQIWSDVTNGKVGLALMSRSKYGYCYDDDEFRLTLLRSAGNPDMYPNLGRFNIEYAIYPHSGDWAEGGVLVEGEDYNIPAYVSEPRSLSYRKVNANAPLEKSFVSLDKENVLLSGFKQGEDGKTLVVRLCEMEGKETNVTLTLPKKVKKLRNLTIIETAADNNKAKKVKSNSVTITLKPHQIVTLGLSI